MYERTFVMIKPDGVERGLVGEVISTFERAGLRITRLEMLRPDKAVAEKHYPCAEEWLTATGRKALQWYKISNLNILDYLGTDAPAAIGRMIRNRFVEFLCSGDVVVMVVEGNLAISNVRRLCGNPLPTEADPASIRGRFSIDSPDLSFAEGRPVLNLVHAANDRGEAEYEISLWFGEKSLSADNERSQKARTTI